MSLKDSIGHRVGGGQGQSLEDGVPRRLCSQQCPASGWTFRGHAECRPQAPNLPCFSVACWMKGPPGMTRRRGCLSPWRVPIHRVAWTPIIFLHDGQEVLATRPLWFPVPERPHRHPSSLGGFVQTQHFPSCSGQSVLGDLTPEACPLPAPLPGGSVHGSQPGPPVCGWPPWLPRAQLSHPPLHFRRPPAPNPHRLPTATFLSHPPTRLFSCYSLSWGVLSSLLGIGQSSSLRHCLAPFPH